MAYYQVCPECGANLDPGERCDCRDEKREAAPVRMGRPQAQIPAFSLSGYPNFVKPGGGRGGG